MANWLFQRDQGVGLHSDTLCFSDLTEMEKIYYQEESKAFFLLSKEQWDEDILVRLQEEN